jgi:protein-disulfide isomerase-like protein with CxxC motif
MMKGTDALKKMQAIEKDNDFEGRHVKADDFLCELLLEVGGYEEVVELFKDMEKWYA